jgi:hypothetical protein
MRDKRIHGWSVRPGMKLNKVNRRSGSDASDPADPDDPAILWHDPPTPDLTVRWTVRIGVIKSGVAYRVALEHAGWEVPYLLSEFLESSVFICTDEVKELDLVSVSVDELGFDAASYSELCWTAQRKLVDRFHNSMSMTSGDGNCF